jgi:hypothetical protein
MTYGLGIIGRSMSIATAGSNGYAHGNVWQYHPRSDRHSKIICWAILFDLMLRENLIRRHVKSGRAAFGVNHKMRDYTHDREKDLDLVICRPSASVTIAGIRTFADMVDAYTIDLTAKERKLLAQLPQIPLSGVQTALVAMEAKAAMTEFGKARPRLYDELNSSHLTIHGDTDPSIAAGFAMVNLADSFVSPLRNPWSLSAHAPHVSSHRQPQDATSVIEKVKQLPRRSATGGTGFDALGLVLMECRNDGSPVTVVNTAPAPQPGDSLYYDNFIERIETIYAHRFASI